MWRRILRGLRCGEGWICGSSQMGEELGDAEVEPGVEGVGEEGDVAAVGGGF